MSFIIYWADTGLPLSVFEYKSLSLGSDLLSISPTEVLLQETSTKRKVLIKLAGSEGTPPVPLPKK